MRISELEEGRKYKVDYNSHTYEIRNNMLYVEKNNEFKPSHISYNDAINIEFEEVVEYVTGEEAFKAWLDGKRIYYTTYLNSKEYVCRSSFEFEDKSGSMLKDMLKEKRWAIEN